MERYLKILNSQLSLFSTSEVDSIERRINSLNDHTPWMLYVTSAGVIIFLIYILFSQFGKSDLKFVNIKTPFKIWICYLLAIIGGSFGAHQIYLRRKYYALIYIILLLTFLIINFNFFYVFLKFPAIVFNIQFYSLISKLILYSLGSLLCLDLVLIPFYTYRQNNNIYKKHFETELILGNQNNSVDDHLKDQRDLLHLIKSNYDDVKLVLDDESIREDTNGGISGFFKNIVTLGKSNALEKEVARLKTLQTTAISAQTRLQIALDYHNYSEDLLSSCRIDVFRNLSLAKELVSFIKSITSNKENRLVKDNISEFALQYIEKDNAEIVITAFNDQTFIRNISSNFSKSFDKFSNKSLELNKVNLINSGIDVAVNVIENLFTEIGKLNREVSKKRLEVANAQSQISKALLQINKTFVGLEGNILRINEILKALDIVNKSFIRRYEPLRLQVFENSSMKSYLTQGRRIRVLKEDREFWNDVKLLLVICQEYNKINQAKVIE